MGRTGICHLTQRRVTCQDLPAVTYRVRMTDPQPVPTVGDTIAGRVRRCRQQRQLSVRALAERCADLGAAGLTTASITNIERGADPAAKRRRREVTVEELLVLALALDVPPLLLMIPYGESDLVRIAPDRIVHPTAVAEWFDHDKGKAERIRQLFEAEPVIDPKSEESSRFHRAAIPLMAYDDLNHAVRFAVRYRENCIESNERVTEAHARLSKARAAVPPSSDDEVDRADLERASAQRDLDAAHDIQRLAYDHYVNSLKRIAEAYVVAYAQNVLTPRLPPLLVSDLRSERHVRLDEVLDDLERRWGWAARQRFEAELQAAEGMDDDAG